MAQNRVERSLMEDPVGLLHPREPLTVGVQTPVREVIDLMLAQNIGAILVVDNAGKLAGILSERDLLTKVAGLHDDYAHRPIQEFMTRKPETLSSTDTLAFALHKMDIGGYRHMPIVENGMPIAVVSVRDLLRHIVRLCRE
jgi:CBS domain-containing protein